MKQVVFHWLCDFKMTAFNRRPNACKSGNSPLELLTFIKFACLFSKNAVEKFKSWPSLFAHNTHNALLILAPSLHRSNCPRVGKQNCGSLTSSFDKIY